jgi:hypothetical protein
MREGEAIFDQLREKWKQQIGSDELEHLESRLTALVGASRIRVDSPGWIADDLDQPISTARPRT